MKKTALGIAACCALLQVGAAELDWMTDVSKAEAKAKEEHKLVMMDFTGSDWCVWCKKLNAEIFSQSEFVEYAKKNLVPVEIDFPRAKELPADLKKANMALQKKYAIRGFPTVIVLNGDGKKVGQLGYMEGGPKAFIEKLDELKKKS